MPLHGHAIGLMPTDPEDTIGIERIYDEVDEWIEEAAEDIDLLLTHDQMRVALCSILAEAMKPNGTPAGEAQQIIDRLRAAEVERRKA